MSSLSLATLGVGGDVAQYASLGVVDALPPLPVRPAIPVPVAEPEDCRPFNPRPPVTPSGLHPLARPQASLVEDLVGVADDLRQLATDFGLRPYRVFSVVVRWSGGERGRGSATVVSELEFLPTPKVEGIGSVSRDLRPAGTVRRGGVRLTGISARLTEDEVAKYVPRPARRGDECFVEVRMDAREGNPTRRRYVVSGTPERRALDWVVRLTKQDEDRDRSGRPQ